MNRFTSLILIFVIHGAALAQARPSDSQTLQALLAEVRQLRRDLQTSNAMIARAQIALYRLQRQDEAVARAQKRLRDTRLELAQAESDRNKKAIQIQSAKAATSHSDAPDAQTHFDEVVLPQLKSELETLQKQEEQARAEEAESEQQLRDEQVKLEGLNDLLDRYNNSLEEVGPKWVPASLANQDISLRTQVRPPPPLRICRKNE
jgi:chromosome segregation ATPase